MNRLTYSFKTVFRSWKRSTLLMLLVFLASVLLCVGCILRWESDRKVREAASAFRIIGLFEEENQQIDLWEEEYQYLKSLEYAEVEEPVILSASSSAIYGDPNPRVGISYKSVCAYSQTEERASLFTENQCVYVFRYVGDGCGEIVSVLAGVEEEAIEPMQIFNYSSYEGDFEKNQSYIAYGTYDTMFSYIHIFDFMPRGYCGVEKEAEQSEYWGEICSVVEETYFPLTVVSTRSVEDIYDFHENMAVVREGEGFTEEMYEEGANVCMISSVLARLNDLQVGDEVSLKFYEADYTLGHRINRAESIHLDKTEELRTHVSEETFTVVGIYSFVATAEEMLELKLNERTVLVPENTMKGFFPEEVRHIYQAGNDLLELPYVIIHLNTENMERFMQDTSWFSSLQIKLYDQGYSQVKNSLKSFQELAQMLLYVGMLCALLVGCFVIYFECRARALESKVYKALGFSRRETVTRLALSLLLICLPGMIGGWVCGNMVSASIMEEINIEQDEAHYYEGIEV